MKYLIMLIDALMRGQFKYAYVILHVLIFGRPLFPKPKIINAIYAGDEPKMEVCDIVK